MQNLTFSLLCATLLANHLSAQTRYPASAIPDSLLQHAAAVVRAHHVTFQVLNKGEAIETEHLAVTLLDERAASLSEPMFHYYEFLEIEDIDASAYDAEGKRIKNLKKKDITDMKFIEDDVTGNRYKVLNLPASSYPYTVEYTVRRRHKGLMFYPRFQPQMSPSVSVEKAQFDLLTPPGFEVRHKEMNLPPGCKTGTGRWAFNGLPAFKPEPFMPSHEMPLAAVLLAPTEFSFGGLDGDMKSWESLGRYFEQLNRPQGELPPAFKAELQAMTADCPDAECKIRRVYEYLQANTRYFNVAFGIGGWQPAPAASVHEHKYGDCKGLSNYTVAMLNAVGLPACYAIIRAGADEQGTQFPDFPNPWFNHVIVCVPMERDTFWLEAVNQTQSCGFLSDFTDGRPTLVITPTGGQLWRTPRYDERSNVAQRSTQVQLKGDGSASLHSSGSFSAIAQDELHYLELVHDERRKKHLYERLDLSNFEIKSIDIQRSKGRLPSARQDLELAVTAYAAANGKRLFIPLCPLSDKVRVPDNPATRRFSFQPHYRGITESDSLRIVLPEGFLLENSVEPVRLDSPFGQYELSVQQLENQLLVHRKLVLNSTVRGKEAYPDFVAFLKAVAKADKGKVVVKA